MTNIVDSNKEAEIDSTNMELAEFDIYFIKSLADSIHKTRSKLAINSFTKCSHFNLITSLIVNIRAESVTYIKKSLTICCCQVDKLDCPDIGNIRHVREDVVSLRPEIIRRDGQTIEINKNMDHN